MLPLNHISSWCTEGQLYFDGMKFVLQKWWKIIIRIILSSNGVSCDMIMFQVLTVCNCYFHCMTSCSDSSIRIVNLKSVYNMGLVVYFSFVYLLV